MKNCPCAISFEASRHWAARAGPAQSPRCAYLSGQFNLKLLLLVISMESSNAALAPWPYLDLSSFVSRQILAKASLSMTREFKGASLKNQAQNWKQIYVWCALKKLGRLFWSSQGLFHNNTPTDYKRPTWVATTSKRVGNKRCWSHSLPTLRSRPKSVALPAQASPGLPKQPRAAAILASIVLNRNTACLPCRQVP